MPAVPYAFAAVTKSVPFVPCLFGAGFDPSDLFEKTTSVLATGKDELNPPTLEYNLNHGSLLYVEGMVKGLAPARVLIDCGANTQFMSPDFASRNDIALDELSSPRNLTLFDGTETTYGQITHEATTRFNLGRHSEVISWKVTTLQKDCDLVLGIGWLRHHNPYIDWKANSITFNTRFCHETCLGDMEHSVQKPARFRESTLALFRHLGCRPLWKIRKPSCLP